MNPSLMALRMNYLFNAAQSAFRQLKVWDDWTLILWNKLWNSYCHVSWQVKQIRATISVNHIIFLLFQLHQQVLLSGKQLLFKASLLISDWQFQQLRAVFPTVWKSVRLHRVQHWDCTKTWTILLFYPPAPTTILRPQSFSYTTLQSNQCDRPRFDPSCTGCVVQNEAAASAVKKTSSASSCPPPLICQHSTLFVIVEDDPKGKHSYWVSFHLLHFYTHWCSTEDENTHFSMWPPFTFCPGCWQQLEAVLMWHLSLCKSLQCWKLSEDKKHWQVHDGREEGRLLSVQLKSIQQPFSSYLQLSTGVTVRWSQKMS